MLKYFSGFFIFLLVSCSSQHQRTSFEPTFFSQPEEALSSAQLLEIEKLEASSQLPPLGKKRLIDLYQVELNHLSPKSDRASWVRDRMQTLNAEIEPLQLQVTREATVPPETEKNLDKKTLLIYTPLKKQVQAAYQAWNQDDNEKALVLVEEIIRSELYSQEAEPSERNRILNLYFRVAFDLRRFETCQKALELLKANMACSPELSQTAEVFAIYQFVEKTPALAKQTLLEACETDSSVSAKLRRAYWLFRMSEPQSDEQAKYLRELEKFPVPGYYHYLAALHSKKPFQLPAIQPRSKTTLVMPAQVHEWVQQAEQRIQLGLRRDASNLLLRAKKELLKQPEEQLAGLLYVSQLFQAAGNHLEAMKIVNGLLQGEETEAPGQGITESALVSEFMRLYHQPFQPFVEAVAKNWGVDPDFVYSIMRQESAFNPGAVSVAGARGLMQLMPALSKFLMQQWKTPVPSSKGYLLRGLENIRLATYHLHQLNQIAPHPALVAAAYNAGINRVSSWWVRSGQYPLDVFVEFIPVNETRNYVKLVLRNLIYYKGQKNEGRVSSDLFALSLPPPPFTAR
ncbi:lytic transglycosylase domain-containing protein [bacterium]|nr:lytic transglycosylase domain-containing protein [bacterium]